MSARSQPIWGIRGKDNFKGRHFEAALTLQAVSWYLLYPLSYRDIEEMFLERGLAVDHSTPQPLGPGRRSAERAPAAALPRTALRLSWGRRDLPIRIRGQWRSLDRAINKHGHPVDFLLTAKRDLDAANRFFRKALQ